MKNPWDPGSESGATSTQPDWLQGRIPTQGVARFMPCQGARLAGDSVGTLRGDPGTEMRRLGTETGPRTGPVHVCTLGSCGTPNSQSAMLPMPVRGRGRGSSLGRDRVPEDQSRCMLDWVSRDYIYREREAAGSPGAGGSLRVNTKGPCQACIPAQGQTPFIAPGRHQGS